MAAATAQEAHHAQPGTSYGYDDGTVRARALGGFVVAVIVILNLHILVGLEDGYAASPTDVIEWSVPLGVVDIALLVAGPVLGIVAASSFAVGTAEAPT